MLRGTHENASSRGTRNKADIGDSSCEPCKIYQLLQTVSVMVLEKCRSCSDVLSDCIAKQLKDRVPFIFMF